MPPYSDETLPVVTLSLREFNDQAHFILNSNRHHPRYFDFVNFVLAGRIPLEDGTIGRVKLDPIKDLDDMSNQDSVIVTRDYDSIIGISTKIPFTVPVAVYPLANFRDSLRRTNHLTHSIRLSVSLLVPLAFVLLIIHWMILEFEHIPSNLFTSHS